jgi:hypothetical protein
MIQKARQRFIEAMSGIAAIGAIIGIVLFYLFDIIYGTPIWSMFVNPPQQLRTKAIELYNNGKFTEAIACAEGAFAEKPDDRETQWILAYCKSFKNERLFEPVVNDIPAGDSMYISAQLIDLLARAAMTDLSNSEVVYRAKQLYRSSFYNEDKALACVLMGNAYMNDYVKQIAGSDLANHSSTSLDSSSRMFSEAYRLYMKAHRALPSDISPISMLMLLEMMNMNIIFDSVKIQYKKKSMSLTEFEKLENVSRRILGFPSLFCSYVSVFKDLRCRTTSSFSAWPKIYAAAHPSKYFDTALLNRIVRGDVSQLEIQHHCFQWYQKSHLAVFSYVLEQTRPPLRKYFIE